MWAQGEPADVDVSAVQAIFGTLAGRLASAPPEVYVLPGSVLLLTRIQTRRAAALTATLAPHLSASASASATARAAPLGTMLMEPLLTPAIVGRNVGVIVQVARGARVAGQVFVCAKPVPVA